MRLYDANSMIGTYVREQVQVQDVDHFVRVSAESGIEKAVAYHADARSLNPLHGNAKLVEVCKSYSNIEPCFVLSPHYKYSQGWPAMERQLLEHDVRFVRLFPSEHGYTLSSVHMMDLLDSAGKLNLVVMLGYNEIYQELLGETPYFEELCRNYRHVRFVLTAAPHRRNMMWYSYLEQHPNVYVEMSQNNNWQTYEQIVGLFGSEKLLWGSHMPFNHPGPSVSMLAYASISEADKENIGFRNLQRLMGRE